MVVSLEDELSVLDQRYGDLLKCAHQLDADGSDSSESDLEVAALLKLWPDQRDQLKICAFFMLEVM